MLEYVLPIDILIIILSLLDEISLRNYDTAICNKEYRSIFLESLKLLKYSHANKWSFTRNIKNNSQICDFRCVKYVSDICVKLIINKEEDRFFSFSAPRNYNIDIVNHNIKYLHIDLGLRDKNTYILSSIEGNNIFEIVLCYVNYINIDLLKNLSKTCPNLKKVKIIFCDNINIQHLVDIFTNFNIELYIKNK